MGRVKKTLQTWCKEYEDLEIVKKSDQDDELVCKYCHIVLPSDPRKKPYDRIREHVASARHVKLKEKHGNHKKEEQQTLFDVCYRQREKEKDAEGVIHDFVRAIAYSGLSIEQADGPLGKLFRKNCPAARTMPSAHQLRVKQVKEVFQKDFLKIQEDIAPVKVSVIVDESPDVLGYPTVNTLLCYYSKKQNKKQVCLADVSRVKSCNSYSVASVVTKALQNVGKSWKDVIAVSSDSAEYMRKMVKDVRATEGTKLLHIRDIPHLIHVSVDHAIAFEGVADLKSTVIKFGALFKHANKLYQRYQEICIVNGVPTTEIKKPPAVVPSRWYSFFQSLTAMIEMWDCLIEVVDDHKGSNSKILDLREILSGKKQEIYAKGVLIHGILEQFIETQQALESGTILMPQYHHLASIRLPQIIQQLEQNIGKGEKAKMLLSMLPKPVATVTRETCQKFCNVLGKKWRDTSERNLNVLEQGVPNQLELWRQATVLDPFKKSLSNKECITYEDIFTLAGEMSEPLNSEFNEYIAEDIPGNPDMDVLDYWYTVKDRFPLLSDIATTLLCLPNGSCDVERSFSQMRYVQRPERSSMQEESLMMMMILFVNKDTFG